MVGRLRGQTPVMRRLKVAARAVEISSCIRRKTIEVLDTHRFDVDALERYLRGRIAGAGPPFMVRQFRGGQSNPTYYVRAVRHPA